MNCPCTSSGNWRLTRNSLPTTGRIPSVGKTGLSPLRPANWAPERGVSQCWLAPVPSPQKPWPHSLKT